MTLITTAGRLVESLPLPDAITTAGMRYLIGRTRRRIARWTWRSSP